jgi:shikimate kinase
MASGKTTVARTLAQKLQLPYLDIDTVIEQEAGMEITQIFNEKGEIYFRKLEHEVFVRLVNDQTSTVLALGGGTPCYAGNHLLLNADNVTSVYLKASIGTLHNRLLSQRGSRPLVAEQDPLELKDYIAKHLFDRSYYYNHATFVVSVDNKSVPEIVSEIAELLT